MARALSPRAGSPQLELHHDRASTDAIPEAGDRAEPETLV